MEDVERAALRAKAGRIRKQSDKRHRVGWNLNARADAVIFEEHQIRQATQETPRPASFSLGWLHAEEQEDENKIQLPGSGSF